MTVILERREHFSNLVCEFYSRSSDKKSIVIPLVAHDKIF